MRSNTFSDDLGFWFFIIVFLGGFVAIVAYYNSEIKEPLIIIPGRDQKTTIKTPGGVDLETVEKFKQRWLENEKIVEIIREYQKNFHKAFEEYNMKFILGLMNKSKRHSPLYGEEWAKERALQESIENVTDSKSYTVLDIAYYVRANMAVRDSNSFYEKLSRDEFGSLFVIKPNEEMEFITKIMTNFKSSDEQQFLKT